VTYPAAETDTEIDTLVQLPGVNILLESKGGRFNAEGRRGAPLRVERHQKDLVEKAADQNARAMRALKSGLPFKTKDRKELLLASDNNIPIIVTFDRIDPFAVHFGKPADGELKDRSWVVALADLILLTEVLPTPSEFAAYAAARIDHVRAGNVRVFVEADALGAWCVDRLTKMTKIAREYSGRSDEEFLVSEVSSWMNDYFGVLAMREMGLSEEEVESLVVESPNRQAERRPSPQVPGIVVGALEALLSDNDPAWIDRTKQAFAIQPRDWQPLEGILRRAAAREDKLRRDGRKQRMRARSGYSFAAKLPLQVLRDDERSLADPGFLQLVVPASSGTRQ
jgi:hypothetical protein